MKFRRVVTFTRKLRFESSVISYGSQTNLMLRLMSTVFESSNFMVVKQEVILSHVCEV